MSYTSQRIQTSANTVVTPAFIVGARLVAATSVAQTVHLHDPGISATTNQVRSTSAATRVLTLTSTSSRVDESTFSVRIRGGTCVVSPVGTTNTLYLFIA